MGFVYPLFAWVEIVKSKNSKTGGKKGGSGIASRKALNDITNKASLHPETSIKIKNLPKEDINVKEEMFLHDHKKCIEAQKATMRNFDLETVLPNDGNPSYLDFTSAFNGWMYVVLSNSEFIIFYFQLPSNFDIN